MNIRLGTKDLKVPEIALEIGKRNLTFGQVMAQVEKEGIEYSDGKSYVCSAFVAAFYKRAGVFGDIEFEVV